MGGLPTRSSLPPFHPFSPLLLLSSSILRLALNLAASSSLLLRVLSFRACRNTNTQTNKKGEDKVVPCQNDAASSALHSRSTCSCFLELWLVALCVCPKRANSWLPCAKKKKRNKKEKRRKEENKENRRSYPPM